MLRKISFLCLFTLSSLLLFAQTPNNTFPYSYRFGQKLNKNIYDKNTRYHSSLRPFFTEDSLLAGSIDSILNFGVDSTRKTWVARKLLNEHLIDVRKGDYTAYADFLPDFMIGNEFDEGKTTWLNTRGFQVGGTVGKKFSFYASGFENQGVFPEYYLNFVRNNEVVPGQGPARKAKLPTSDWSYATAILSFTPVKYLNVTLGNDRNFVGDGYRSLLLSDNAMSNPFLKLTGTLGSVRYMALWSAMVDNKAKKLSYDAGNRRKGGVYHYLDWNVSNRLSIGFFDAIIWAETDSLGNRRGFDPAYANPIIFLRPQEYNAGSPDNALLGLNVKYEILKNTTLYGQFLLDEFEAKSFLTGSGSHRNKWGIQLGFRGADLFKIERLNYLFEANIVKPHTYSGRETIISYSHYRQSLAHPRGSNFGEALGILNYSFKRFDFMGQMNVSRYGLDYNPSVNYGGDIFKPYRTATVKKDNFIGQGITTDLVYLEGSASYLINPKYNLRLELGGVIRSEKSDLSSNNTTWLTFGLRSSLRSLYKDF